MEGDHAGLIGANGNGKSTLLNILAGDLAPEEGSVIRKNGLRLTLLEQVPVFRPQDTIEDVIKGRLMDSGLSEADAGIQGQKFLSLAGFADFSTTTERLSGGWKKRLQIAGALASNPDLLLLDEPTNHLDMEGCLWLEDTLQKARFAWLLVTHDRYFLNRTVKSVIELNSMYPGGSFTSVGGYQDYLANRDLFLENQASYAASLANKVRREDAWLQRGPKARTTKAKSRIDQAESLKDELSSVRSRMNTRSASVDFQASGRKTKKLIEVKSLSKVRGEPEQKIIDSLSFSLGPGVRMGILGRNGSGKSTILSMLSGKLAPDSGEIVLAPDLNIAYFDQHRASLDLEVTLKRALSEHGDSVIYRDRSIHVVTWAKTFGFRADQLETPVRELSGGEQARVSIAKLMLTPADVLLLDEPTNDLDIPTLETLEESLASFPGAIVFVSHDRQMMVNVCNQFLALHGEGEHEFYADYDQWERDYRAKQSKSSAKDPQKTKPKKAAPTSPSRKRLSYMDQREYDSMETRIMEAELQLESCQAEVERPDLATQSHKLAEAYEKLKDAQSEVDKLYARWAELEAKISE